MKTIKYLQLSDMMITAASIHIYEWILIYIINVMHICIMETLSIFFIDINLKFFISFSCTTYTLWANTGFCVKVLFGLIYHTWSLKNLNVCQKERRREAPVPRELIPFAAWNSSCCDRTRHNTLWRQERPLTCYLLMWLKGSCVSNWLCSDTLTTWMAIRAFWINRMCWSMKTINV